MGTGTKPRAKTYQRKPKTWGDIRDVTHANRTSIGFKPGKKDWVLAPAQFTKHALRILGHPVMEDWETPYMRKLAQIATSNGGVVLEIGYGMGISARFIQKRNIRRHIIIEMNEDVTKRAKSFARNAKRSVTILHGMWEDAVKQIPDNSIDGILFDTYPLRESEVHKNHFTFFKTAYKKLRPGGILTYYSDEINRFHPAHLKKLVDAGFQKRNIDSVITAVRPPVNCEYWKSKSILAPIIRK